MATVKCALGKRGRPSHEWNDGFDGKPDEATRALLKANGFRWSPSQGAWQRMLNDNGRYAAQKVRDELDAIPQF